MAASGPVFTFLFIIAAKRDLSETDAAMEAQIRHLENTYETTILFSHSPVFEVSSSEIREMVEEGKDISRLVPSDVASYISDHRLYREE